MSRGEGGRPRFSMVVVPLLAAAPALLGVARAVEGDAPAPRTHVVEIRGFEYHPQTLEIAPGDTVVWVNRDAVPHTATAADGGWDSGSIEPEARRRRVLTAPGRTPYTCTFHPSMRGTLVVR